MTFDLLSPEFIARRRALSAELDALLAHPGAEEIIANDWLHDGSLPVPSVELIRYLAIRLFTRKENDRAAEEHDRAALVAYFVGMFREESPEDRKASIPRNLQRLDCFKYLHTGKKGADPYIHEWLPIVAPFLDNPAADGRRILARGFLETLTLLAIHNRDHKRLQSLSVAVRIIAHGEDVPASKSNRVKGEILRALPYLGEELQRCPSQAEIQYFITRRAEEMEEEKIPVDKTTWAKAFKDLGYPAQPRTVRMDSHLNPIEAIARKSAEASRMT